MLLSLYMSALIGLPQKIIGIHSCILFIRIFKLARHITGLQTLGMTLRNRYPILLTLRNR